MKSNVDLPPSPPLRLLLGRTCDCFVFGVLPPEAKLIRGLKASKLALGSRRNLSSKDRLFGSLLDWKLEDDGSRAGLLGARNLSGDLEVFMVGVDPKLISNALTDNLRRAVECAGRFFTLGKVLAPWNKMRSVKGQTIYTKTCWEGYQTRASNHPRDHPIGFSGKWTIRIDPSENKSLIG